MENGVEKGQIEMNLYLPTSIYTQFRFGAKNGNEVSLKVKSVYAD